jgi:hypothetical protein
MPKKTKAKAHVTSSADSPTSTKSQVAAQAVSTASATTDPTGNILINIVDGARQPLATSVQWSATIHDGRSPSEFETFNIDGAGSTELVKGLPYFGSFFDNYTVLINAKDYDDAGWMPVAIQKSQTTPVYLMLLEDDATINFNSATWAALNSLRPRYAQIFESGIDDAADQYAAAIEDDGGLALGCFLNLLTAMSQIVLPSKKTPIDYFWQVVRNDPNFAMAQDRFFAYVDKNIVDDVVAAGKMGSFSQEPDPGLLHPGATLSYKQTQFDITNVQLTFHQNNTKTLQGPNGPVDCIVIEPDIDYYKDLLSHFLLEVLPNKFTGGLTDPRAVYMLRWMAGKQAGSDFNPLYTLST